MSDCPLTLPSRNMVKRLPVEVLQLIALKARDEGFRPFCDLRLVCTAFNAVAEPLAFSSLSFRNRLGEYNGLQLIKKLRAMGMEETPHSRWTATLLVERDGLFPSIQWLTVSREQGDKIIKDRDEVLIPALASLSNLKRASLHMGSRDLNEDILQTLSKLPKLSNLSLTFAWDIECPPAALAQLSNLSALHLTGWRLFPSFLDALRALITQCSDNLEALTLLPYVCPDERSQWTNSEHKELHNVPLHRVAPDSAFRALKRLVVDSSGVKLNSSSLPTFGSLTHLDVRFGRRENVSQGLWESLERAGVCLEALTVFPVTKPIFRYLDSYSGLRTLKFCHAPDELAPTPPNEDLTAMASNIFNNILPKHRDTLRHLTFEGTKFYPFAIDDVKLKVVMECANLERLWFIYDPPRGRAYDLANADSVGLLSRIVTTLPRLRELTVQSVIRNYDIPVPPGSIRYRVEPATNAEGRVLATNIPLMPLKVAVRRGFWESVYKAERDLEVGLFGDWEESEEGGPAQRPFRVTRIVQVEWRS